MARVLGWRYGFLRLLIPVIKLLKSWYGVSVNPIHELDQQLNAIQTFEYDKKKQQWK